MTLTEFLLARIAVRGGKWASRALFAMEADVTVYWPDVRPCYDEERPPREEWTP